MAIFTYKALTKDGAEIQNTIDARDRSTALQLISAEGQVAIDLHEGAPDDVTRWYNKELFQERSLNDEDAALFCQDMAMLLEQHISIHEALSIASATTTNKALSVSLSKVGEAIEQGASIGSAFDRLPDFFPSDLRALIRSGAAANALTNTFRSAANFYRKRSATKRQVLTAAAYPVFLILAAVVVFVVILVTMVPALYDTIASTGGDTNGTMEALNWMSIKLITYWIPISVTLMLALLAIVLCQKSIRSFLALIVPSLRVSASERSFSAVASRLEMFLSAGEPFDRAISAAIENAETEPCFAPLSEALSSIRRGGRASDPLLEDPAIPSVFVRLFDLGERTNTLPRMMELAAQNLQLSYERRIARMVSFLTPILTLIVGALIAFLVQILISAVLEVSQVAV